MLNYKAFSYAIKEICITFTSHNVEHKEQQKTAAWKYIAGNNFFVANWSGLGVAKNDLEKCYKWNDGHLEKSLLSIETSFEQFQSHFDLEYKEWEGLDNCDQIKGGKAT